MGKQEVKHPDKASYTGAYSAGVVCDGWLHVSGQGPVDMRTGQVIPGTTEEQTRLTLENIEKILRAAGCGRDDVVKCGCYLADINTFDQFDRAYAAFFGEGVCPARTTVQAGLRGIKVEIDAIARIPNSKQGST